VSAGPTTSSTSIDSLSPDDPKGVTILAAYRASLEDFNFIATKAPVQGNSPTLSRHMANRQLTFVVKQLAGLAQMNEVDIGGLSSTQARVKQFEGSKAVVEACELDTVQIANALTGVVVRPAQPSTELVNVLLEEMAGTWKVTSSSNVSSGCL